MKNQKSWYKQWWFFLIVGIIVAIAVIIGFRFTGNYLAEQSYYISAQEEYDSLYSKIYKTSDDITEIENIYGKNGMLQYYDFTKQNLDNYANLINEQSQNYNELINWVITNDKYLKYIGKSDLAISETLTELRSARDLLDDAIIKVSTALESYDSYQALKNLSDMFSNFASYYN